MEKMTFERLVKIVSGCTENNNHTRARKVIAKYYNLTKFVKILDKINEIHSIEGHMPLALSKYREDITSCMFELITDQDEYMALMKVL